MTLNAVESWNHRLMWARKMPIVYVLESVRKIMHEWFFERLIDAKSSGEILCNMVESHLANLATLSDKFVVQVLTDQRYKIVDGTKSHVVDLAKRECDCWEFQLELIPCRHAVAAIRFANYPVSGFVAECYKTVNLKGMWGGDVNPVPDLNEWVMHDNIKSEICNSPPCHRQVGRPRLRRRRSALETSGSNRKRNDAHVAKVNATIELIVMHIFHFVRRQMLKQQMYLNHSWLLLLNVAYENVLHAVVKDITKRNCPRVEII
ncbi:hypothetical protein ACS0TY_014121 [Phlomoides rotata]